MAEDHGASRHGTVRRALLAVVIVGALIVLAAVAAIMLPILTHHSAGSSGQTVPDRIVSDTSATGADGRTRTLAVETEAGEPADLAHLEPGETLVIRGSGFDPGIGIYVSICAIPDEPGEKPSPCLGGLPEGAMEADDPESGKEAAPETSVWITDDWAWRSFATQGYDDPETGGFTARLLVAEPVQEGLDCTEPSSCAVTTRADHTAAGDRVQDVLLPVAFAG